MNTFIVADPHLILTANGIPVSLRPAFQEYDLEDIKPDKDAFTIIERTLAYGRRAELRWLFNRYGAERLRHWLQQSGGHSLPRRRRLFWAAYFNLDNLPQRKSIWPH